jgi:hypothetical protein
VDPGGDLLGMVEIGDVLTDDEELVSRDAGKRVARPQRARQPVTDGDQQPVPDEMPIGVVDRLEAIDTPNPKPSLSHRALWLPFGQSRFALQPTK